MSKSNSQTDAAGQPRSLPCLAIAGGGRFFGRGFLGVTGRRLLLCSRSGLGLGFGLGLPFGGRFHKGWGGAVDASAGFDECELAHAGP